MKKFVMGERNQSESKDDISNLFFKGDQVILNGFALRCFGDFGDKLRVANLSIKIAWQISEV